MSLRVKSSAFGSNTVDAIYIDASTARIGIFNRTPSGDLRLPEYTLDITGDLRVTGNLLIEGTTTSIDVDTLRVEDKNIEIAKTAAGATLTGVNADNAGLILDTSDVGQKLWTWKQAQDSWTTNVNLDLSDNTKTIKIGGQDKLTNTSLVNVTKALDLDEIGTLLYLNVDNININGITVKSGSATAIGDQTDNLQTLNLIGTNGINITAFGDIAVQDNQKITGVANPTDDQDVATKIYADTEIANETIVFSLDVTGMGTDTTLQTNVASVIQSMYPAAALNTNKLAKIHTTSYAGATVTGINITVTESPDTSGVLTKNTVAVDQDGTLTGQAIEDIESTNTASGSVVLVPTRTLMTFQSTGSSWTWISTDTPYSF